MDYDTNRKKKLKRKSVHTYTDTHNSFKICFFLSLDYFMLSKFNEFGLLWN